MKLTYTSLIGIMVLITGSLFLGGYYFMSFVSSCFVVPEITTDISSYEKIRTEWSNSGLADHFPSAIPKSATNTRLSYVPGFLQGGAHFQLRITLPPKDVEEIERKYAPLARHKYHGGDRMVHANEPNGVPTTFFYTNADSISKDSMPHDTFPEYFSIYVLKANPAGTTGISWNHGSTAGIAISRQTNEVVYWCESW